MNAATEIPKDYPERNAQDFAKLLTLTRKEIVQLFEEKKALSLARAYEGAVILMNLPQFPGKVHFVGHAVRDIANRLPEVLIGHRSKPRVQYTQKLNLLTQRWKKANLPLTLTYSPGDDPIANVPVPRKIYLDVCALIQEHSATNKKAEAAEQLFSAFATAKKEIQHNITPVIEQWLEVTEWFMTKTHLPVTEIKVQEDELKHKFKIFEDTILGLIGSFFQSIEALDEILEDTNS